MSNGIEGAEQWLSHLSIITGRKQSQAIVHPHFRPDFFPFSGKSDTPADGSIDLPAEAGDFCKVRRSGGHGFLERQRVRRGS